MAIFDLPLDELEQYRPEREEPADFDSFWAATLDEARAARRPTEFRPAHPELRALEVLDVTFSGFAGQPVKGWLIELADPELSAEAPIGALKSPKSRLQEFTQRRTGERPSYRLTDASGPDHERSFRIEVWIDGELMGIGEGPSRRAAETAAAAQAIDYLRAVPGPGPTPEGVGS